MTEYSKSNRKDMESETAECSRPCKRKRTSSSEILDLCEVKGQKDQFPSDGKIQGDVENANEPDFKTVRNDDYEIIDETGEIVPKSRQFNSVYFERNDEDALCSEDMNNSNANKPIIQHDNDKKVKRENDSDLVNHASDRVDSEFLNSNTDGFNLKSDGSFEALNCRTKFEIKGQTFNDQAYYSSHYTSDNAYKTAMCRVQTESSSYEKDICSSSQVSSSTVCNSKLEILPDNDENVNICYINTLPPFILVKIFGHLSLRDRVRNVSLVCRTWYDLSHDSDLWRVIDLQLYNRVKDDTLMTLTSYNDRVMLLDLTDSVELTNCGIEKVVKKCKYIQTLKLSRYFKLNDVVLKVIGETCHSLKCIHLDLCVRISNDGIIALAKGCPDLEELNVDNCLEVTDDAVTEIARHCDHLKCLSVNHCSRVTDSSVIELCKNCPLLECLALTKCNVSDESIQELSMLKHLRVLEISCIPSITPASILQMVKHCTQLECLNLSLNPHMNDECVETIAKHCHHLKQLYCVACTLTDTALEAIGQYSKTIQNLDVGWCKDITDDGVKTISMSCPSLRKLGLIRCDSVTIETMEELVEEFPHIEYNTFVLESRRLIERAREEGFQFDCDNDDCC